MAKAKKKTAKKKAAERALEEDLKATNTVWLTDNQLTYMAGAGSLVCVPRAWLKKLGFDPDQESSPVDIAVTLQGQREVWDTERPDKSWEEHVSDREDSEREEEKEFLGHE
jgi:hypothetical protein